MKKLQLMGWIRGALGFSLTSIALSTLAQIPVSPPAPSTPPVVTIQATDPAGTWSGDPAVFTVFRSGDPTLNLDVYYDIGGTATNGLDYKLLSHWVQIPSGVFSGEIVVYPINSGQADTRTVVLTLTNSPLMGPAQTMPIFYQIGSPSSATAQLTDGSATNIPPVVRLVYPTDGSTFYTPLTLPLVACARDFDGSVVSVEFFADGVSLGIVSNPVSILPPTPTPLSDTPSMPLYAPFVLVWSNAPPGTNILLTAKATDNAGASTVSPATSITIRPGPPPPPPNFPPVVRITSPANGATFRAPLNLPIVAYAADKDGYVVSVEFFAGTNDLGPGHRINVAPAALPPSQIQPPFIVGPTNYWELIWSNAPPGKYALRAVATDNLGLSSVSDPVNVTLLQPLPPPTATNVVNIIAVDPIAIEGTNCWPWLGLAGAAPSWTNFASATSVWRYFSNCAPKSALFAVRRFGPTNEDLAVTYSVGGTATNGVDYLTLPGTVTIPSGHQVGLIPLVPLDDGQPDINSTVILKLTPSTGYTIGLPASAAAVILDPPTPAPVSRILPDKTFLFRSAGPDAAWFHLECASDLLHWKGIATNQVFNGSIGFVDPDAPMDSARFYRVVPEAGPPQ